jgi:hypothetical protein
MGVERRAMIYWEIIADRLKARGWSFGYCTVVDNCGQSLYVVDAQRREDRRYVMQSDEMLTAFLELERIDRRSESETDEPD